MCQASIPPYHFDGALVPGAKAPQTNPAVVTRHVGCRNKSGMTSLFDERITPMRLLLLLTPLVLLGACGQGADDPGLGGLSPSEASQLNDAAAMLDANSVSANAVANDQEQAR
jgi:hypothetical protein